jgi:hypothetical protein
MLFFHPFFLGLLKIKTRRIFFFPLNCFDITKTTFFLGESEGVQVLFVVSLYMYCR